jgi:hypothetical protein
MAAFEVIALDTATPQLRAPGAADTYTFPRAVEMPLGTANGVLYLNGSKVVTSGSGLTFDGTNLGVGKLPGSQAGFIILDIGAAATSGLIDLRQNNVIQTRIYNAGANAYFSNQATSGAIIWNTADGGGSVNEQMRLTSTGLGIGTNNPVGKLQVTGSSASFIFNTTGTEFYNNNAGQVKIYTSSAAGFLSLGSGGRDQDLVIAAATGNVGIGTSSPGGKLDVNGSMFTRSLNQFFSATTRYGYQGTTFLATGAGSNTDYLIVADTALKFGVNGSATPVATLDASGNLGLGVTPSGNYLLQAGSNASAAARGFNLMTLRGGFSGADYPRIGYNFRTTTTDGSYLFDTSDFASSIRFASGGFQFFTTSASGTAGNAISFTQAMTLHASGGLSVGSTSDPGANTIALTKLSIKVDGPFFTGANIDSGSNQLGIGVSSGTAAVGLFTANTERIRIKSGGQLRYVPLAADPAGAENGDVYYNSTTNKLRVYAGGAWVDLH